MYPQGCARFLVSRHGRKPFNPAFIVDTVADAEGST
jgi:hypothetical protein